MAKTKLRQKLDGKKWTFPIFKPINNTGKDRLLHHKAEIIC
jgi:hypothetical protein